MAYFSNLPTPSVEKQRYLEEQALIASLQAGDPTAYQWIVTAYHARVYQTCLGFLCHIEDAEDITQEVFIEAYRSIGSFRGDAKVSTWLHRIAVSKSLELLRYQKRKKRSGQLLSLLGMQQAGLEPRADQFDHPGFALERREQGRLLMAAVASLPAQQRIAFTLHKIDEHSYQETADIMQLTPSAVDSLVFRARANLKKRLAGLVD
jgi:RNA polymerase sigma factor (sigma-70 family)